MATIAENLTKLQTARTNIASAITAKGGTVSQGDGFEDFATDIATIPSGSGGAAYYTRYKATSSTSTWTSLGFGIVGDKGTEGSIFVAIKGIVSSDTFSPNNPLVLSGITLSDYLTSDIRITVSSEHQNTSTVNYLYLTFDVANNQLLFSQGNVMQSTGTFTGFTTTTL